MTPRARSSRRRPFFIQAGLALLAVSALAPTARAARPPAAKLLPQNTVLMLSVADAPDMAKRFMNTAMGRMSEDPQLKPLVKDLYGSVTEAVAGLKEQAGLSLPELLAIPQGEVTLAVVAPEESPPAAVVLLDAGNQLSNARKLLARGTEELDRQKVARSEETVGGTKLVIYDGIGPRRRKAIYFEKDGTLVLGTDLDVLKQLLAVWDGRQDPTLADNEKFAAVMRRCGGADGQQPQFVWYLDPIALMKNIGQQNVQVRLAVALLPALGLDGVGAVGGSVTLDAGQFDSIAHFHLLLDNPRDGIVEMIALGSGNVKPEPWVPADVASYMTLHWKFGVTHKNLTKLFDSFQGEGAFSNMLNRRILEPSGVDLEKDILPSLDGRVTYLTRIDRDKPISPQSNATLVALKLKHTEPVVEALQTLAKKFDQRLHRQTYSGTTYYEAVPPQRTGPPDAAPDRPQPPRPCVAVFQDYLVMTDRASLLEKSIDTGQTSKESLADALDFKLIASKIVRQCGGTKPSMISFDRPEEGMRFLYDLATAERTRQQLQRRAENSAFFKSVQSALEKNPLPPFAVLQQYLAPGGGMIIDDQTGIHYTAFTLRRKTE